MLKFDHCMLMILPSASRPHGILR